MSRLGVGNVQYITPRSNVYTVLVALALVVEIAGLVALFMRASVLFPGHGLLN